MRDGKEKPSPGSALAGEPDHENCGRDRDEGSPTPASSLPKEDLFAWLQVAGAFVLNLNTWSGPPQCPMSHVSCLQEEIIQEKPC